MINDRSSRERGETDNSRPRQYQQLATGRG